MNIIICDDILDDAKKLQGVINQVCPRTDIIIFENTDNLLEFIKSNSNPAVCIIGISPADPPASPGIDGAALSASLRNAGYCGHIVFCSASKDFAYDAFCAGAFSYLLKPVSREMIIDLFNKIKNLHKTDYPEIKIKTVKGFACIALCDIAYVEVISHNVYFNLLNGKILVSNSALKEIANLLLSDKRFAYSHRSYIVNIDSILHLSSSEIILKNNKIIPISRTNYSKLQKKFKENNDIPVFE